MEKRLEKLIVLNRKAEFYLNWATLILLINFIYWPHVVYIIGISQFDGDRSQ